MHFFRFLLGLFFLSAVPGVVDSASPLSADSNCEMPVMRIHGISIPTQVLTRTGKQRLSASRMLRKRLNEKEKSKQLDRIYWVNMKSLFTRKDGSALDVKKNGKAVTLKCSIARETLYTPSEEMDKDDLAKAFELDRQTSSKTGSSKHDRLCMTDFSSKIAKSKIYMSWSKGHKSYAVESSLASDKRKLAKMAEENDEWDPEYMKQNIATVRARDPTGRAAWQCEFVLKGDRIGVFRVGMDDRSSSGAFDVLIRSPAAGARPHFLNDRVMHLFDAQLWAHAHKIKGPSIDWATGFFSGRVFGEVGCAGKPNIRGSMIESLERGGYIKMHAAEVDKAAGTELFYKNRRCPMVFAHRGIINANTDQENSVSAFRVTQDAGIRGVEVDVFMSRRGPIVSHDKTLERQLGLTSSIYDVVQDLSLDLDAHLEKILKCEILTPLEKYLYELQDTDLFVDLDLKPASPPVGHKQKESARKLSLDVGRLVRRFELEDRTIVSSMDVNKLMEINPDAASGFRDLVSGSSVRELKTLYRKGPQERLPKKITIARAHHGGLGRFVGAADAISRFMGKNPENGPLAQIYHYVLASKEKVEKAHSRGELVGIYTAFDLLERGDEKPKGNSHDPEKIEELIAMQPDWIETDEPIRLWRIIYETCARAEAAALDKESKKSKNAEDDESMLAANDNNNGVDGDLRENKRIHNE